MKAWESMEYELEDRVVGLGTLHWDQRALGLER